MKKLIPKIVDIICFVGGSMLIVYNLLDFNNSGGAAFLFGSDSSSDSCCYYYSDSAQILAAFGLALIVLGFLIRSWRKDITNN